MGMEAFGESGGVEEKRPKQSSGQLMRRYMNYGKCK